MARGAEVRDPAFTESIDGSTFVLLNFGIVKSGRPSLPLRKCSLPPFRRRSLRHDGTRHPALAKPERTGGVPDELNRYKVPSGCS
jgi:hypothetical protein